MCEINAMEKNYHSLPTLFKLVIEGDLPKLKQQVDAGIGNIHQKCEVFQGYGSADLLQVASALGKLEIVEYLVNLKLVNGENAFNPAALENQAIRWAAYNGHLPVVQYLAELRNDAGELVCNPADLNNFTIRWAALYGHLPVVQYLAELRNDAGAPVCDPAAANNYAFRWAALYGHLPVVQYLAELRNDAGEFVCNPADLNDHAIYEAADAGNQQTVAYLYDLMNTRGQPVDLERLDLLKVKEIIRDRNQFAYGFTRAFAGLSANNPALRDVAHLVSQHCEVLSPQDDASISSVLRELPRIREDAVNRDENNANFGPSSCAII